MAEAERRLMPKALSQLIQTCDELIESEGKYVETLETIVEVFLVPLRTWAKEDDAKNAGAEKAGTIAPAEVERLFGSVEMLLKVNQDMLKELRSVAARSESEFGLQVDQVKRATALAMALATAAAGPLRMYSPHVQSFPEVCALLRRLLTERPRFAAAARVLELQPRSKGL